jgi:hypothetical protein
MKVIIFCIVLFALTYNVNGAPADNVDDNGLIQLLKNLKTEDKDQLNDDESETAKLDDDDSEMIEALVLASLLSKNLDDDNAEWGVFKKLARAVVRHAPKVFRTVKKAAVGCAKNAICRGAAIKGAMLLAGRKK